MKVIANIVTIVICITEIVVALKQDHNHGNICRYGDNDHHDIDNVIVTWKK